MKALACSVIAGLAITTASANAFAAAADGARDDGAYGRFDGRWTIVADASIGERFGPGQVVVGGDLRLRWLDSVGVVVGYEGALTGDATSSAASLHAGIAAIELRPFFPARFLQGLESGTPTGELLLDSIGLEVGALFGARANGDATPGAQVGLLVGVGAELPLMAYATGFFLRFDASLRWSGDGLRGVEIDSSRSAVVSLAIAWHQVIPQSAHASLDLAAR
jgi:hypothetical protein